MLRYFGDACGCRTTPRCKVLSIESDLEVHPQPLYCKVRLVEISDAYGDDLERYLNPMPQTSVGPSSAIYRCPMHNTYHGRTTYRYHKELVSRATDTTKKDSNR